jgi:signal transduction histidine kinase
MKTFLAGKRGGLIAFLVICILVAGGLGWATRAALQLEREQLAEQVKSEHTEKLRLALWRLDGWIRAILAREDSRPFNHYSAIFAPPLALDGAGTPAPPGSVLEPSPLLHTDLPEWMLLHFQVDERGWESPQVLSNTLKRWLLARPAPVSHGNVTASRQQLLAELSRELTPAKLLDCARRHAGDTTIRDRVLMARMQIEMANSANTPPENRGVENWRDYASRAGDKSKLNYQMGMQSEQRVSKDIALLNVCRNGEEWLHNFSVVGLGNQQQAMFNGALLPERNRGGRVAQSIRLPISSEVTVGMSRMVAVWIPTTAGRSRLLALRLVRVEEKEVCQGIVLDGERLQELLAEEVQDLFARASLEPISEPSADELAQAMTTMPLRLDPGPLPVPEPPGWTTLRIGLSLAWAAAIVALVAVGLVGWSLLDLSERRIRFVSAVTHELRTPLTTLQLYLDMLTGGMVREETQRTEYLHTLQAETDRLTRLVGNVLDFSRLESQGAALHLGDVSTRDILAQVEAAWRCRCGTAGKELVIEDRSEGAVVHTDAALLGQILGNLLDNACKYSKEATDKHVWLRASRHGARLFFEVEDRGPGVPTGERQIIFRPFRRGRASDATTGGVGLGLSLAHRWTQALGGKLVLQMPAAGGACFQVELPVAEKNETAPARIPDRGGR